jgi:hypothetical protein
MKLSTRKTMVRMAAMLLVTTLGTTGGVFAYTAGNDEDGNFIEIGNGSKVMRPIALL